ncbi:MAG: hypothetical protein J5926_07665 [Ruminococcus sp.]|nr:hypothetical protein [Ruminococcus sp.]
MKRVLRFILAFVIVIGLFSGMMFLFFPEALYQTFYHGDRIKADVDITVDGHEVSLSDCDISCFLNVSDEQEMAVSGNRMKLKGNDSGTYNWIAQCNGTELRFYVEKPDDKDCITFDMDFDIDTEKRTIAYNGWIMHPSDGLLKREKAPVSGVYDLDYEHHSIGVYIHDIRKDVS